MGAMGSATNDVGSAPKKQRKVLTSQEVELLDIYHSCGCPPFQDKFSIGPL